MRQVGSADECTWGKASSSQPDDAVQPALHLIKRKLLLKRLDAVSRLAAVGYPDYLYLIPQKPLDNRKLNY